MAVDEDELLGVLEPLDLGDEEGEAPPACLDDGGDLGPHAALLDEGPEGLPVLVGDVDDGGDGLYLVYVVAGGVPGDAEVGALVDDVGFVVVLLDDDEGLDSHLLKPEEEAGPEPHPVACHSLVGEDDLAPAVGLADVLGGDVYDVACDAFGVCGADLAVWGGLYLHGDGGQDLQLGVLGV